MSLIKRTMSAAAVVYFLTFTATAQDSEAISSKAVVANIKSVDIAEEEINPPNLLVTATAELPTGGYSDFVLSRAVYIHPPEDGIQDYFFHATPPSDPVSKGITEAKASNRWKAYPNWVVGVRIHGAGDGILERMLSGEDNTNKTIEQIYVPKKGLTEFSVTGRSSLFRITVSTPSGGTISNPVIRGNAKLLRSAEVTFIREGGPTIGALTKEFVFRGTSSGKVEIEIQKTNPTSPMPVVEVYKVTIN